MNETKDCGCRRAVSSEGKRDRYVTFDGLDCDGNARRLMAMIDARLTQPGASNAFWEYFGKKRRGGSGPTPDDLFLIHAHINQLRDQFDAWEDAAAQELLEQIEEECC